MVRAPWLTQGYYKNPDKGQELWEGGYLHTGDVAVVDATGWVRITDRIKDVIKTGGEWISSLELESLMSQAPGVSEVAVVGVPHEKWGERPVAWVVGRRRRWPWTARGHQTIPEQIRRRRHHQQVGHPRGNHRGQRDSQDLGGQAGQEGHPGQAG